MSLIERLYQSAANAGLTVPCRWTPAGGGASRTRQVGFAAPSDTVLSGLALDTDYAITCPVSAFPQLAAGDTVRIARQQYQVRDVRSLGDGSEIRASLTRL